MSATVEWYNAAYTVVELVPPGTDIGDDTTAKYALVLSGDSAAVFEGTLHEIDRIGRAIRQAVVSARES